MSNENKTTTMIPAAFKAAAKQLPHPPRAVGEFWVSWVENSRKRNVRHAVLDILIGEYPGFVETWQFGGVAAVLSDRFVREFVPVALLIAEPVDIAAIRRWLEGGAGRVRAPFRLGEVRADTESEAGR